MTAGGKTLTQSVIDSFMLSPSVPAIIDRSREEILQSPVMKMKFVTTDKLYEHVDEIMAKLADNDSYRNQSMFEMADLKNKLIEYTHKQDFFAYQDEISGKLDKLAPWDSVRTLYNEFSKFLPYFEFEEYKKEVLQMVETLQTKREAGELEARAQKHVDTRLNAYMSNKEWEREKAEIKVQFNDIEKTLSGVKKKFDNIDTDLT